MYPTVFELNASITAGLYGVTAEPKSLLLSESVVFVPEPLDLSLALGIMYSECRFIFSRTIFDSKYRRNIYTTCHGLNTRQAKANFNFKPATHRGTSAPSILGGVVGILHLEIYFCLNCPFGSRVYVENLVVLSQLLSKLKLLPLQSGLLLT